jgi:hypothetical protein
MRIRKTIHRVLDSDRDGVSLRGGVNFVVNANVAGVGGGAASSSQVNPVPQKGASNQSRTYTGADPTRRSSMTDEQKSQAEGLSPEELAAEAGEEIPDREAMSLINANVAAPINAAVALNALSDNSTAVASATQTAPITQTN